MSENVECLNKKEQIVGNCMNQLKKNKEEKKIVEPFQSFPILGSGQIIQNMNYQDVN